MLGHFDVSTIGVLSSATVFSMAVVSLVKAKNSGIKIKGKMSIIIAISSIMGGILGRHVFNNLIEWVQNDDLILFIQASMLAVLMLMIYLLINNKDHMNTLQVKNILIIFLVGLGLGALSSFLGIGGGPLNVAILSLLFSMDTKNAIINSIFIIFFSQLSNLLTVGFTTGFAVYDLSMLGYMISGGILGGFIGTVFARKFSSRKIEAIFNALLILIIFINIFNMIQYFV